MCREDVGSRWGRRLGDLSGDGLPHQPGRNARLCTGRFYSAVAILGRAVNGQKHRRTGFRSRYGDVLSMLSGKDVDPASARSRRNTRWYPKPAKRRPPQEYVQGVQTKQRPGKAVFAQIYGQLPANQGAFQRAGIKRPRKGHWARRTFRNPTWRRWPEGWPDSPPASPGAGPGPS